jgi:DNA polymerase-4
LIHKKTIKNREDIHSSRRGILKGERTYTQMKRIIMHIDMNSYFATCEQQDNLAWRGKPLGVCEHLGGIIIAASIEAKKWGIKTAMPVWEAKKLYPKIILTPTNPDRYRYYTKKFLKVFADYTDDLEKYSIDEAFLDVSRSCNIKGIEDPFVEAERIAKEIKQRMLLEVGDYISCSVGIASNKLLAKIGSDMQKPNGLVIIRPQDKDSLYKKLKLTDIPGIGSRMERRLFELGINSLVELRDYPKSKLVEHFGVPGIHLYNMGQLEGSWKEKFIDEPIKSIGHMYTVAQEFRTKKSLEPVLYKLSEMVAARLRLNGLMATGLSVHIHTPTPFDSSFNIKEWGINSRRKSYDQCLSATRKISCYLEDGRDIFLEAMAILKSLENNLSHLPVYLVGVTAIRLVPKHNQSSLFDFENRKVGVMRALDNINDKYGDFTIARVPAFEARNIIRDSIGFGRMKEFKTTSIKRTFYGH